MGKTSFVCGLLGLVVLAGIAVVETGHAAGPGHDSLRADARFTAFSTTAPASGIKAFDPDEFEDFADDPDFVIDLDLDASDLKYKGPFKINVDGAQRPEAQIYLPQGYSHEKALPLVMLLHGYTGTAKGTEAYFALRNKVTSRGFILVEPQGIKDVKGDTFWNATDSCCDFHNSGVDDVSYLLALIRKVQAEYRVNARMIYSIGHSNGGFMVNRLACETDSVFAGFASLAGAAYLDPAKCRLKSPITMLQIHALDDGIVRFAGEKDDYPGARETVAQWVSRNGCSATSSIARQLDIVSSIPDLDTLDERWDGCHGKTEVALWTIRSYDDGIEDEERKSHKPHSPKLGLAFNDRMLDFLFAHKR